MPCAVLPATTCLLTHRALTYWNTNESGELHTWSRPDIRHYYRMGGRSCNSLVDCLGRVSRVHDLKMSGFSERRLPVGTGQLEWNFIGCENLDTRYRLHCSSIFVGDWALQSAYSTSSWGVKARLSESISPIDPTDTGRFRTFAKSIVQIALCSLLNFCIGPAPASYCQERTKWGKFPHQKSFGSTIHRQSHVGASAGFQSTDPLEILKERRVTPLTIISKTRLSRIFRRPWQTGSKCPSSWFESD